MKLCPTHQTPMTEHNHRKRGGKTYRCPECASEVRDRYKARYQERKEQPKAHWALAQWLMGAV